MKAIIKSSVLHGEIVVPASKSAMQRACALALLHRGITQVHNPGKSNDDLAAIEIARTLGAKISYEGETIIVESQGIAPVAKTMHCGESGLSLRMFASIAAISHEEITITGTGSLLSRPISFFEEVLPGLGVEVKSAGGKLPLKVIGPLQPKDIIVDGSLSSQYLTGLLIAFGAITKQRVVITVNQLASKPYIDLTLQMMKKFGYNVEHENYRHFIIHPAGSSKHTIHYTVESDWSSASPLLVAGAVAGEVTLAGLDMNSMQADRALLGLLQRAGCEIKMHDDKITISRSILKPFQFDATDCPDLFPPLAALAAYCNGISKIEGAGRLLHKESNRALTIQKEFAKMQIRVDLEDDTMIIYGGTTPGGNSVFSNHDHRIAMACAVLALGSKGNTEIDGAEAVNKSYPEFFTHLQMLGASVSLQS